MFRCVVGGILLSSGMVSVLSSIMWAALGSDLWWPRLALGMILFGLWYAGSKED